jgi:hypothetical protein
VARDRHEAGDEGTTETECRAGHTPFLQVCKEEVCALFNSRRRGEFALLKFGLEYAVLAVVGS